MGIPDERYSIITEKHPREICLLRGFHCAWGRCTFCDYIDDNGPRSEEAAIHALNAGVLSQVTGCCGRLEVINSGSVFELPDATLDLIKRTAHQKNIRELFFEAHWMYRHRLSGLRRRMNADIVFKIGAETFDNDFREKVLHKNAPFESPEEVARYFDSPCIMVAVQGQTKDMIRRDIDILKTIFRLGTVNVYNNNTTPIRQDPDLAAWFLEEFAWLKDDPAIEVLYEITDFGVG